MSDTVEKKLLEALGCRQMALVTAESCTGGLLASRITRIPGSSSAYWGGMIVYDNSAKASLASVSPGLIEKFGAVSPETARALADGALARAQAASDRWKRLLSVVTTGVAGPSGGTAQKPVGLCFIGISVTGEKTETHEVRLSPSLSREELQREFSNRAFELALQALERLV